MKLLFNIINCPRSYRALGGLEGDMHSRVVAGRSPQSEDEQSGVRAAPETLNERHVALRGGRGKMKLVFSCS